MRLNGFEWLIILAIVIILFGATKLPQIAKGLGESIRVFKKEVKSDEETKSNEDKKSSN